MIKWFWSLFESIRSWWRGWWRRQAFGPTVILDSAINPAHELAAGKLVLIGTQEKQKWLRFECPCGCGDEIALNLMPSHYPHWRADVHADGSLSVYPSVDAGKCGSHFWIRSSRIQWVDAG